MPSTALLINGHLFQYQVANDFGSTLAGPIVPKLMN